MRNVALLESTMQQIVDHPELHDQSMYFVPTDCGTAACFAGWACIKEGWEVYSSSTVYKKGHGRESAAAVAKNLLGIRLDEASKLFDPCNTREMLELMVKDLVNGDAMGTLDDYAKACGLRRATDVTLVDLD